MAKTYVVRTIDLSYSNSLVLSGKGITVNGVSSSCILPVGSGSVSIFDPAYPTTSVTGTYKNPDGTTLFTFSGSVYPMEVTYSGSVSDVGIVATSYPSTDHIVIGHTGFMPSGGWVGCSYQALTQKQSPGMYPVARTRLTWSISFNGNGGTISGTSTFTKKEGATGLTALTSSTVTRSGYRLLGWATTSSATSASISPGASISTPISDLSDADLNILSNGVFSKTYYAVWESTTAVISYNKGSYGTGTNTSVTTTKGASITLPGVQFTRTDYVQTGWSTSASGTSKNYDLNASYTVSASVTLYPYWTYTTHTLSLSSSNSDLGSVSGAGTYGHGRSVTVSATPNLRVATFTRWSDSGAQSHNVTVNANMSLTATFSAKSFSHTYGVQNSSGMGGWVAVDGGTHVTSTSTTSTYWGTQRAFTTGCNENYRFKRWAVYYKTIDSSGTIGSVESVVYPSWSSSMTFTGGPVNISGTTITRSATGAYVITKIMAEFEPVQYVISTAVAKTSSGYGRWDSSVTPGTVSGAGTYDYGTSHSYTATAATNYTFAKWNDESTANPKTATVSGTATWTAYFTGVSKTVTLVAEAAGGRGTIAFTDGGGASREYGTQAKLKATPANHYKFVKWTDGSTDAERTVNVSSDVSFQAQFSTSDTVTIKTAVTPSGGGTVSGGGTKTYDSSVTLTATAATGYTFVSWQDGVATATRSFTADDTTSATTWTATFRKLTYTVGASASNGSVEKTLVTGAEPTTGNYEYGSTVRLAVTPASHYHFVKWSDNNTSNPRVVTVTSNSSYTATCSLDYYTVNVTSESATKGAVSVTKTSGSGSGTSFGYGAVLSLVATPTGQYNFSRWSDGNTSATRSVTVTGNITLVAYFTVKSYTLSVSAGGGGSASIDGKTGSSATFEYGSSAVIRATASDHYSFSRWNDGSTDNPRTVTITGNATYTASFAVNTYTITATAGAGGTVTGTGTYGYGTQATLVATATWTETDHYRLVGWYDAGGARVSTEATYKPTVTGTATYTARFEKVTHTIATTVTGDGVATGSGSYAYGAEATLVAAANAHSYFVKWTKGGSDYATTPTIKVTVSGNATYTAVFVKDTHTLTTGVVDTGTGIVTAGGTYNYGTTVTLTATPATNYHFEKWYRNGADTGLTNAVLDVVIEGDVTYTAKFVRGRYAISATVSPVNSGSVTGTGTYDEGTTATLSAIDGNHYVFSKWSDGVTTRSRTVSVDSAKSFTAEFVLERYTISASANDVTKGSVTGSGTYDYSATASVLLTAASAAHCHFLGWKKDGATVYYSTDSSVYVPVTANASYIAVFAKDSFAVVVTAGTGVASITGGGVYDYGSTASLSAAVSAHYEFDGWYLAAGARVSSTNPYSFEVTSVFAVEARATIVKHTLIVTSTGDGAVTGGGAYDYGTVATLTATANAHSHFVKWTKGGSDYSTSAEINPTVDADASYVAVFAKDTYAITTGVVDVGTGSVTPGDTCEYGSTFTATATPAEDYYFVEWLRNGASTGLTSSKLSVTVTANADYKAKFRPGTFQITTAVTPAGSGTVTGAGKYAENATATLTAVDSESYTFVKWSDDVMTRERKIIVTSAATYTAEFALKTFTLGVTSSEPTKGIATGGGTYQYSASAAYQIVASPATHCTFLGWKKDSGTSYYSTNATETVPLTADTSYVAYFGYVSYTVTAVAGSGGTVTGTGSYEYGTQATLVATPTWTSTVHKRFVGWYDTNDTKVSEDATYRPTVTGSATYTAKFETVKHTVTASAYGDGTVAGSGQYDYNSTATLTSAANSNSHFVKWTKGGSDYATTSTITPTVTEDVAYVAVFAKDRYTISTSVIDAGTGTVTEGGEYDHGSTFTATATPAVNYHFVEWYLNGSATGNTNPALSATVTGSASYSAKFEIGRYKITATVQPADCGATVAGTGTYNEGSIATLTAQDAVPYVFDKWSDGVAARVRSVTVTESSSFVAIFKIRRHTLTVTSSDTAKGTVTGGGAYDYSSEPSYLITASAKPNCSFTGWRKGESQEIVSTAIQLYVPLTEDTTYTAVFAAERYTITAAASGPGTVSGGGTYDYGTGVTLSAVAEPGYAFSKWSDNSVANPRTVVVVGDAVYTAVFLKQQTDRGRVMSARHSSLFW